MNRAYLAPIIIFISSLAFVIIMLGIYKSATSEIAALRSRHAEVEAISTEHRALSRTLKRLKGKKGLTNIKGLAQAVDEIFKPLGLRDKVTSIKALGLSKNREERAEVVIKDTDLNETMNFLYALEHTPMPLSIRKAEIKTSFENPDRLNTTLLIAFILR